MGNRIRENPKDYRNVLGWPDIWPNEKKKDSGHYAYPFDKRIAIVEHYFQARKEGEAKNKDIWADEIYGISGKTLGEYIKEYQTEQRLKKQRGIQTFRPHPKILAKNWKQTEVFSVF